LLFLRKAAQDEALLDAVIESDKVSDEVIGFHCQQAAEKMLKALLSDLGAAFHKTHEPGALILARHRLSPAPDCSLYWCSPSTGMVASHGRGLNFDPSASFL
jgi:hypothetical protein